MRGSKAFCTQDKQINDCMSRVFHFKRSCQAENKNSAPSTEKNKEGGFINHTDGQIPGTLKSEKIIKKFLRTLASPPSFSLLCAETHKGSGQNWDSSIFMTKHSREAEKMKDPKRRL